MLIVDIGPIVDWCWAVVEVEVLVEVGRKEIEGDRGGFTLLLAKAATVLVAVAVVVVVGREKDLEANELSSDVCPSAGGAQQRPVQDSDRS